TLIGKAAIASQPVAVLRAKMDAFIRGDLAAARKLSSRRAQARLDRLPREVWQQIRAMSKREGASQKKALANVQRVVFRGDHAIVIISKNEWATVVKEDGKWRSDD